MPARRYHCQAIQQQIVRLQNEIGAMDGTAPSVPEQGYHFRDPSLSLRVFKTNVKRIS